MFNYQKRQDYKDLSSNSKYYVDSTVREIIKLQKQINQKQKELDRKLTSKGCSGMYCEILEDIYFETNNG